MALSCAPQLSHVGIFVYDIDRMTAFYTEVFGLRVTDEGPGVTFNFMIRFLTSSADQHHQLALAAARVPGAPSTVMQLSFKVSDLQQLREVRAAALEKGATKLRGLNHGNALSIYFMDPEDNTVEVYLDTPWYVKQPHGDPLDLDASDAAIWADTERRVRTDPTFMTQAQWAARFADGSAAH